MVVGGICWQEKQERVSAFVSLIVPNEGLLCVRALGLSYDIGTQSRRG